MIDRNQKYLYEVTLLSNTVFSLLEYLFSSNTLGVLVSNTVYGGRYMKNKKELLKSKFKKFKSLTNIKPSLNELPKGFPECFKNDELIETIKGALLSLNNNRNILIVGL